MRAHSKCAPPPALTVQVIAHVTINLGDRSHPHYIPLSRAHMRIKQVPAAAASPKTTTSEPTFQRIALPYQPNHRWRTWLALASSPSSSFSLAPFAEIPGARCFAILAARERHPAVVADRPTMGGTRNVRL